LLIEGEQGLASGTVETSPEPTNGLYAVGLSVTLSTTVNELSEFVRWEGVSNGVDLATACGVAATCDIVMAGDTLVTPVFRQKPRLVVNNLYGGNKVTFNPPGIPCAKVGDACQFYSSNTVVTLSGSPGDPAESFFSRWVGDADCLDGQVTVTDTIRCTAKFTKLSYKLLVVSDDLTVTSDTNEINCGLDCEQTYQVVNGQKTVELSCCVI